jgi:hypothetical protein
VYAQQLLSRIATANPILPPLRPDALELTRIVRHLRSADRRAPVGVLGSTLELRDCLHESGFDNVHVLDSDAEYFRLTSHVRVYDNSETFILGDWADSLERLESSFAVLLSDLTSGYVPYSSRARFYAAIARSLRPGGLFIDKALENPAGLHAISEIESRYRTAPLNLQTINYFCCEAIFCSTLQLDDQLVDTTRVYAQLADALRGPRFGRLIDAAQAIVPTDCRWYYGLRSEQLASVAGTGLRLRAKYQLARSQPYYRRAHQYVWEREAP